MKSILEHNICFEIKGKLLDIKKVPGNDRTKGARREVQNHELPLLAPTTAVPEAIGATEDFL